MVTTVCVCGENFKNLSSDQRPDTQCATRRARLLAELCTPSLPSTRSSATGNLSVRPPAPVPAPHLCLWPPPTWVVLAFEEPRASGIDLLAVREREAPPFVAAWVAGEVGSGERMWGGSRAVILGLFHENDWRFQLNTVKFLINGFINTFRKNEWV